MTSTSDCLIWVGHSYPTIDDYVSEARQLGCCRKVPFWPSWLRKGSRVFLAHHGGLTKPAEGVIFGYFELGGVDVIFRPDDYDELGHCMTLGAKIDFLHDRCPRGLPVHTKPDTEDAGSALADFIAGFGLGCGATGFGRGFSTEFTRLVRARDCPPDGLRCGPDDNADGHPSFYLVDELEREITDEFCELLEEVIEKMMKRDHRKTRRSCLRELRDDARARSVKPHRQAGLRAFTEAMKRIHDRTPDGSAPLMLFREPYPMFLHGKHAWFLGLARIDGDDLLAQVHALKRGSRGPVRIAYCGTTHASRRKKITAPAPIRRAAS